MELTFSSIEEVKEFVKQLKGTRGGKGDKDDEPAPQNLAPAPLQPPAQAFNPGGFAPPAAGAGQAAAGPFAAGAPAVAPEVLALVGRITTRIDGALAAGQPADAALAWFRGEVTRHGHDASQATMDQIKTVFLSKLGVPALELIAKQMNA
jgi:hypothetical protein